MPATQGPTARGLIQLVGVGPSGGLRPGQCDSGAGAQKPRRGSHHVTSCNRPALWGPARTVKPGQQADTRLHGTAVKTEPKLDIGLLLLIFSNPLHLK